MLGVMLRKDNSNSNKREAHDRINKCVEYEFIPIQ